MQIFIDYVVVVAGSVASLLVLVRAAKGVWRNMVVPKVAACWPISIPFVINCSIVNYYYICVADEIVVVYDIVGSSAV